MTKPKACVIRRVLILELNSMIMLLSPSAIRNKVIQKQAYRAWVSDSNPDSKVHGANMGPTWVLSAPDGPHVGPWTLLLSGKLLVIDMTQHWGILWRRAFIHSSSDGTLTNSPVLCTDVRSPAQWKVISFCAKTRFSTKLIRSIRTDKIARALQRESSFLAHLKRINNRKSPGGGVNCPKLVMLLWPISTRSLCNWTGVLIMPDTIISTPNLADSTCRLTRFGGGMMQGLSIITRFWLRVGELPHLTNNQKPVIYDEPYIISFLTCSYWR